MNTKSQNLKKTPSEFQTSIAEFINIYFDQNLGSAKKRFFFSIICLLGIWILLVFSSVSNLGTIRLPPIATTSNTLSVALGLIFTRFIDPLVLTRLIVIMVAFISALHFSSQYLKTIYQLQSMKSARNILLNLSFGFPISSYLHVEDGQIASDKKNSPILSFGGPGKVKVGFDSAVLFERMDGTAGIIGSTANLAGGYFQLKSFEKIRNIFNLKNHTLSFDLLARTNDGIPLRIKNIRLTFSILRGTDKVTLTNPYPFNAQAIYWLVFYQPNNNFLNLITNIITTTFLELIREFNLEKIFPHSGNPSLVNNIHHRFIVNEKIRERKRLHIFSRKTSRLIPKKSKLSQINLSRPILHHPHHPYGERNQNYPEVTPLNTISRRQLSASLIKKIKQEFSKHMEQPGIKCEWVNLGTWTPLFSPTQINRLPKTTFTKGSSSDMIDDQHTNMIQALVEEFLCNLEYDSESHINETDFNLFLKKLLKFLKTKSEKNESQSTHDQDIGENAIINLERNLKENQ